MNIILRGIMRVEKAMRDDVNIRAMVGVGGLILFLMLGCVPASVFLNLYDHGVKIPTWIFYPLIFSVGLGMAMMTFALIVQRDLLIEEMRKEDSAE